MLVYSVDRDSCAYIMFNKLSIYLVYSAKFQMFKIYNLINTL
jgi:hypothetical protein